MSERNVEFCREWLKKAGHDLITARAVLALPDGPTDTPCFHAQQAVEKALKGLLTWQGIAVGRTHDLLLLLDQVVGLLPEMEPFETAFGAMSAYAVDSRYPGDFQEPDRMDALEAVQIAEKVVELIRRHCGISSREPLR